MVSGKGFLIKSRGERVITAQSHYSALSGEVLLPGAVTIPVPGWPGLFYRVSAGEARALTDAQREDICAAAVEWYQDLHGVFDFEPEMPATIILEPDTETNDEPDLTVSNETVDEPDNDTD
jgi:hypothetical protein